MPAAASRRSTKEPDASTRDRLLEVALRAFAELGFEGASTREICSRAGVNQGLIPYYFGTKQALWQESVDRAFAELGLQLAAAAQEAEEFGDRDHLSRLIRLFVRFVARHPEFVRVMHDEGKRDSERMRWLVERHTRPLYETVVRLIERGRHLGHLPAEIDSLHIHYILVGAVSVLFHQAPECRRLTGRDPSEEAVIEAHADALVTLFVGPAEERKDA